ELGDEKSEVLAMVQKEGEASRILQTPTEEAPKVETAESAPKKTEQSEQSEQSEQTASLDAPEPAQEAQVEPVVELASDAPVQVQAVDVEPNKIFIAGKAEPSRTARVYINDKFSGSVRTNPNGTFLFELNQGLESGKYDLRVDVLKEGSAEVASRSAVTVEHFSQPVAVAETKPAETPNAEPVVEPATPAKPAETQSAEVESNQPVSEVKLEPETQSAAVSAPEATQEQASVTEPKEPGQGAAVTEEAKPVIQTGRYVIIRRGDNLWRISRRMLGEGRKYTMIFSANSNQIKNPNRIYPGQVFDVPEDEEKPDTTKQAG
ncbi:MAG: LysM peptidoglycan-binding domain-containing protein, partial [Salaquimonas sp.]